MANAKLIRGSDQTVSFDVSEFFTDPDTDRNLNNGMAFLTIKPADSVAGDDTSDSAAVLKKDLTVATHPSDGIVSFELNPADTVSITPGEYAWGAQTKESNGEITEFLFDPEIVEIVADITRRTS